MFFRCFLIVYLNKNIKNKRAANHKKAVDSQLAKNKTVLVAVLKTPKDQRLLLKQHWYRITLEFLPKRRFAAHWLAGGAA